jgi:hypothetical protein
MTAAPNLRRTHPLALKFRLPRERRVAVLFAFAIEDVLQSVTENEH